ncbi:MAG: hypothetical protein RBS81_03950 [Tenuifilaceae bacterium]|jgi:hypothetical protein|nr:hypothetical protein [Tenuifilaceae bacterium]
MQKINFTYRFLTILALLLFALAFSAQAQEEEKNYWETQLEEEVEVLNPVYKPVISFGAGVFSFLGDVKSPGMTPLAGQFGYRVNMSTLFGKKNFFKLNFFVMMGSVRGHDFDYSLKFQQNPALLPVDNDGNPIYFNSAFSTDFFEFGANVEYGFGHFFGADKKFRPFIALGVAPLQFTPKGDLRNGSGGYYHYWNDGTIRNIAQSDPNSWASTVISRDGKYETDLSKQDYFGQGSYSRTSVVFPLEVGFDFYLSDRVSLRVASSIHYALTDDIDNLNPTAAKKYGIKDNGFSDMFTFTYFSLNLDLWSDPKTMLIEKMFADYDFDYLLIADEDEDFVFDIADECPGTPLGVAVDTLGCPLDSDTDGIFDYMDDEANTPVGAIVDERGVQLSEDVLSDMFNFGDAVLRKEVRVIPVAPIWTRSVTFTPGVIPDKFKAVDADADGYISFAELLAAIDKYFDQDSQFTVDDVYELNDFFFSQ